MISYDLLKKGAVMYFLPKDRTGNNCWYRLSPPLGLPQSKADQVVEEYTPIGLQPVPELLIDFTVVPEISELVAN
jgi:hypothetical protein